MLKFKSSATSRGNFENVSAQAAVIGIGTLADLLAAAVLLLPGGSEHRRWLLLNLNIFQLLNQIILLNFTFNL